MTTYPPEPERPGPDQPESNEPGPTEPQRGLEEPSPNDPDPVEPNQSPSSEPEREPFSGNPAPDDRDPDQERDPGGVPPEDPVPGAAPPSVPPDGSPSSSMTPPSTPQPAAPPPPPPSDTGYSPYAGSAVPPAPPPPGYSGEAAHRREARNGLGTAALVCGVIAVVLSFIPVLNAFTWPLGVLAVVFGAIGWGRANKGQATNKNIAITGLVLGIVSFFTFCLIYVAIGAGGSTYYGV